MTDAGQRLIRMEGCFNFRDLGGYRGAEGRILRWRRLFRADALHRLTDADRLLLDDLAVRTVLDLRTPAELGHHGQLSWPGRAFAWRNLSMMNVLPKVEDFNDNWATTEGVSGQYLSILDGAAPAVTDAIDALTDPGTYPVVMHCMAGKDRTGILTAVLLGLLGVADADIVADYALSAGAMERMLVEQRLAQPERAAELEASATAMVHAEPATMTAFLAGLRAEHGCFEGYAASLGRPDAASTLRALVLEP
ncbi:MAG: tyrosine-protein phosphatase [Actinomycetota bacterium]|nr:tyrosine-protein phosphatase [Actinomycetota bacterium]MDQ6946873.1 tyrosine-protein phosphatase [Actinomycetota bacterium]